VHLGDAGQGVNRKRVHQNLDGAGTATGEAEIAAYLCTLAERLRYVRVCCGDWRRVVTLGALSHGREVGIFLDPPYDVEMRAKGAYNTDAEHGSISRAVRDWAVENGSNPCYRIVLAGYEGEYDIPADWRVIQWSANVSYQRHENKNGKNAENRHLERLWLSPHCLGDEIKIKQSAMFDKEI
jgi:hypothetical protein